MNNDIQTNSQKNGRRMFYAGKSISRRSAPATVAAIIGLFVLMIEKTEEWRRLMNLVPSISKETIYDYFNNYILSKFILLDGKNRICKMHWGTARDYAEKVSMCVNSPEYEYLSANRERIEDFVLGCIEDMTHHPQFDAEAVEEEVKELKLELSKKRGNKPKGIKGLNTVAKAINSMNKDICENVVSMNKNLGEKMDKSIDQGRLNLAGNTAIYTLIEKGQKDQKNLENLFVQHVRTENNKNKAVNDL